MSTTEVMSIVQQPTTMAAPIKMVRSSSPKAVVSESSPIKKRRVDGFCNVDYKHRRGSRSGDLALLRVLSAPSSPLASPYNNSSLRISTSPTPRYKPRAEHRIYLLQRPVSPVKNRTTKMSDKTIELRKDHFVFQKPATPDKQESIKQVDGSAQSIAEEQMTDASSSAQQSSISDAIKRAEEIAGPTAVHHKQLIPICDEDVVLNFFNPETPTKDEEAVVDEPNPSSQLPSVISGDATLKEKIEALPAGKSLLFVYPTRAGAEMFINNMLIPVLDPLLRRTVNTHGLPEETAKNIRSTCKESVDNMLGYEDLAETVEHIVAAANESSSKDNTGSVVFEQKMAERAVIKVPGTAWKNAWVQQERETIKAQIEGGLERRGGGGGINYSGIIHPKGGLRVAEELLGDFKKHSFDVWEGKQEENEIEVGVFVIRRL